jgi:hypothetical protein
MNNNNWQQPQTFPQIITQQNISVLPIENLYECFSANGTCAASIISDVNNFCSDQRLASIDQQTLICLKLIMLINTTYKYFFKNNIQLIQQLLNSNTITYNELLFIINITNIQSLRNAYKDLYQLYGNLCRNKLLTLAIHMLFCSYEHELIVQSIIHYVTNNNSNDAVINTNAISNVRVNIQPNNNDAKWKYAFDFAGTLISTVADLYKAYYANKTNLGIVYLQTDADKYKYKTEVWKEGINTAGSIATSAIDGVASVASSAVSVGKF